MISRTLDEKSNNKNRNYTLDVIKLLAAYLVVFIHVPFYGMFGEVVNVFAKIAVPIFFMTSGFFCYNNDFKTILRKLKKIIVILLLASLLYNLCNIGTAFITNGVTDVVDYLSAYKDFEKWLLLITLNVPFSATRLWFLLALIYTYLLQLLVNKLKLSYKSILVISVSGIILHLLIGNSSLLFGENVYDGICRNYLIFGYPFFGIGLLFRHYEKIIIDIDKQYVLLCTVAGILFSFLSLFHETNSQINIGTVLLVLVVFCVSLKMADIQYSMWIQKLSECSLGIYIIHRPITTVLSKVLSVAGLKTDTALFNTSLTLSVCIVSTIVVLLLKKMNFRKFVNRN